jgi:hypothetical protein
LAIKGERAKGLAIKGKRAKGLATKGKRAKGLVEDINIIDGQKKYGDSAFAIT